MNNLLQLLLHYNNKKFLNSIYILENLILKKKNNY